MSAYFIYFWNPLEYVIWLLLSIKHPSILSIELISDNPFSFPKEKQTVLKQSPCKEDSLIIVTDESPLSKQ